MASWTRAVSRHDSECICVTQVLLLPDIVGELRSPKHPKALRWSIGRQCAGGSGVSICILCSAPVMGFKSVFPSCMFTLVAFLISFVPFSPRPPCLPPKPQKMRRPRPLSVCSHKLFNGCMEAFIKVLAGSRRVRECAQCNGSLSPALPLRQRPAPTYQNFPSCPRPGSMAN